MREYKVIFVSNSTSVEVESRFENIGFLKEIRYWAICHHSKIMNLQHKKINVAALVQPWEPPAHQAGPVGEPCQGQGQGGGEHQEDGQVCQEEHSSDERSDILPWENITMEKETTTDST